MKHNKQQAGKDKPRNLDFQFRTNYQIVKTDVEVVKAFEKFVTDLPISTTKSLNPSCIVAECLPKGNISPDKLW